MHQFLHKFLNLSIYFIDIYWPDFLLPPERLSFYAWVILLTGYQEGAFYPTQHFDRVINALWHSIGCTTSMTIAILVLRLPPPPY
ncbi:hypothetical protein [Chamaesiphon sp. VAR_48_metabat_403]|uniref:hypothetical protein n=1 Tax=Chamaesiphon sp. VAR_48_metabat_403 TaxID=2964700 RepID=UPI00286DCA8D|nr:hypothetical protein [Chamaesiphon sp. VAR_48_metabat_403]